MNPSKLEHPPSSIRSLFPLKPLLLAIEPKITHALQAGHVCCDSEMETSDWECLREISKLIVDEKWLELYDVLRHLSNHSSSTTSLPNVERIGRSDVSSMEIVHFACRFNPPASIIRRLASLYPDGFSVPDNTGRLPLHHAAKWGASQKLICSLIKMDRSAVSVQDSQGKTPLHHLCSHYVDGFRPNNSGNDVSVEGCMIQAIEALLGADPSIIIVEDDFDTTALEYAIESNAPYRVVRLLQKASERFCKDREKASMASRSSESPDVRGNHVDGRGRGDDDMQQLVSTFNRLQAYSSPTDGASQIRDSATRSGRNRNDNTAKKSSGPATYAKTA